MHPELFSLVWSAVATKVDMFLYKRIILDQTFTDYGVQQLSMDIGQLEAVFYLASEGDNSVGTGSTISHPLPLMSDAVNILGWTPAERGAIVEALGQLSISNDGDISMWPCRWSDNLGANADSSDMNELRQMHDMLCTRGIRTMHPEHALLISTQRI